MFYDQYTIQFPQFFTADLFDILLPMLNIYQEFVRNHQYSLQILAHCKQNRDFDKLLKQYEAKPDCEERTLETFLTYPMFQVTIQGYRRTDGLFHSFKYSLGFVKPVYHTLFYSFFRCNININYTT